MIYTQLPIVLKNIHQGSFRPCNKPLLIYLGVGITFDYLASSGSKKTGNATGEINGKPYFIESESRDCNFCTRA